MIIQWHNIGLWAKQLFHGGTRRVERNIEGRTPKGYFSLFVYYMIEYAVIVNLLFTISKPVKHIVHLNENEKNGLTMMNLKDCTYQMCWKYPTATKVRIFNFIICLLPFSSELTYPYFPRL